jgi:uroporphyrinogen III methyltransferase/synthase
VRFEVIPGVSSAVAAPNYAGIPLTHRDHCSSFTVITGHEDPEVSDEDISWTQMAKLPGTKVIMMGLRNFRRIIERLKAEGMPAATPVALIRCGTTPRQQTLEGTLETIADQVERTAFAAPAITVIGDVVKLRRQLNWFENRPLFGQRVVVTRARDQAAELACPLTELGAEVLEIPVIKFGPPTLREPLVEAMTGLNAYDWLVFTSANGVRMFFDAFFKGFQDLRDIGGVRIAAVGPATAARLRELHLQVDLVPKDHDAQHVAKTLQDYESIENLRILLLRAEVGTPDLPSMLETAGAIVDDVACYRTEPDTDDSTGAGRSLLDQGANWITFTSGSTVRNFEARYPLAGLRKRFPHLKFASIGPETTAALIEVGQKAAVEARPQTTEGLVKALLKSTGRASG